MTILMESYRTTRFVRFDISETRRYRTRQLGDVRSIKHSESPGSDAHAVSALAQYAELKPASHAASWGEGDEAATQEAEPRRGISKPPRDRSTPCACASGVNISAQLADCNSDGGAFSAGCADR